MVEKKTHRIKITDRAYRILKDLANTEPECKSTHSDMIEMLYDDYCETHGEPDVETG
jgi:hypothetical protein